MDGKALAKKIKQQVAAQAAILPRTPGLAVILVGENPASQVYVRGKEKDCEECGILNLGCKIPAETSEEELLGIIAEMNADPAVDGPWIIRGAAIIRDMACTARLCCCAASRTAVRRFF